MRRAFFISVALALCAGAGCQANLEVDSASKLECDSDADCPADRVCVTEW